jgi:hypothetical protein
MTPNQLRAALTHMALSQRAAARLLNIDERTMRKYVAGDLVIPEMLVWALRGLAATNTERAAAEGKPALVWKDGPGDQFTAKVERGAKYVIYSTAAIGHGPGYAARRGTRGGNFTVLGHTDTSEQAKELCERHYIGRKD